MAESTTLASVTSEDDPHIGAARALLAEYARSLDVDLSFQNFDRELAAFPADYLPPDGALILAFRDAQLAGSVAMRRLESDLCEMKRLFVRAHFRGLGLGHDLAAAVIETARLAGYQRMRLDTLPGMHDAQRLYRALGFREIDAYYENPVPGTRYMELDLRDSR